MEDTGVGTEAAADRGSWCRSPHTLSLTHSPRHPQPVQPPARTPTQRFRLPQPFTRRPASLPCPHRTWNYAKDNLWNRCLSLHSRCNFCYGPKRRERMINQSWDRPKVVKGGMTLAKSTNLRNKHKHRDIAQGIGINANEEAGGTPRTSRSPEGMPIGPM